MSERFDVVVIGFGYAGGVAAIAAHDAGARVLLIEKQPSPGGISVCSAGGVRCSDRPGEALSYLLATNGRPRRSRCCGHWRRGCGRCRPSSAGWPKQWAPPGPCGRHWATIPSLEAISSAS